MRHALKRLRILALIAIPIAALAAGGKGYTSANNMGNAALYNVTYTATANVYAAIFTTCPTSTTAGTEASGGSYARSSAIAAGSGSWTRTLGDATHNYSTYVNAGTISFPTSTGSWGTANCFGLFDASTSGNLLYWGPITGTPTIGSGVTASFAGGSLTITEG